MKRFLLLFLTVFSLAFASASLRAQDAPPPPPPAYDQMQGAPDQNAPPPGDQGGDDQDASYQTFYDQLGSDGSGNWVQTDQYGYVFQPNVEDPNWAPYTVGSWAYSDAGWTWVSDEPWGWATYHYGRWVNIDGLGWVWIPGSRWAPAWVSWRSGGGYYGWAPLPPDADEGDGDYHFGDDVDVSFDIGPGCYNFIPYADFGDPNCGAYIVDRNRNYGIIGRTRNVTNFNVGVRGAGFHGVFAGGPSLAEVNAHSSRHVSTVRLAATNTAGPAGLHGNQLSVFAPKFNAATAHTTRPANVSRTVSNVAVNRGTSIHDPLVVNSRLKPKTPTASEVKAATALSHAPASAHVGGGTHSAAATTTFHPEAANPGEAAATGEAVHHATTATPNSSFHPEAANTGEAAATGEAVHHATTETPNSWFHPEEETHTTAPATVHPEEGTHTAAPSTFHPEEETHTAAPTEEHHTEPAHTESFQPQEQHSAPAPQEQHSAPAQEQHAAPPHEEQHSAPASHPSGGGGGGGGKPTPAPGSGGPQHP
jgi:hypothetical protein